MVHYLRFLRTPHISLPSKKHLAISAVATITTDLGDAFYAQDVEIIARLVDATSSAQVLSTEVVTWQDGARAVKLSLSCNLKYNSRLARVHITTKQTQARVAGFEIPELLDAWSPAFLLLDKQRAEPFVERTLALSSKSVVGVWEETGDSIARHIWDASLGFAIFFQGFQAESQIAGKLLQALVRNSKARRLKIIEVGAGCGIVGIAFAQLVKCDMLLTDLDDAQEIMKRNVDNAAPATGSSIDVQVLEWGRGLDALAVQEFDLILVSDCIYNPDSSILLVQTLEQLARQAPDVLILVGFKWRHEADRTFFERMQTSGFEIHESFSVPLPHHLSDHDISAPVVEMFVYKMGQASREAA